MKRPEWIVDIEYPEEIKWAMTKQVAMDCEETKEIAYMLYDDLRTESYKRTCPNCHTTVISRCSLVGDKYCRECGQRINVISRRK